MRDRRCTAREADYGVHRPEPGMVTGSLRATCRYCGKEITRAHRRSTWWREVEATEPETFPRADDPGEGAE